MMGGSCGLGDLDDELICRQEPWRAQFMVVALLGGRSTIGLRFVVTPLSGIKMLVRRKTLTHTDRQFGDHSWSPEQQV